MANFPNTIPPKGVLHPFLQTGAIASLPDGSLLIGWGRYQKSVQPLNEGVSFFVSDYFLRRKKPWISFEGNALLSPTELEHLLEDQTHPTAFTWSNPFKSWFLTSFSALQRKFSEGVLQKAVPYIFETSSSTVDSAQLHYSLKIALRHLKVAPFYLYGCWDATEGVLGLTPEYLFKQEENGLHTMALAGTGTPQNVWNNKNLNEHNIVITGIKNALVPFGSVNIEATRQIDYPLFSHLATPISLENLPAFEKAVKALHPTPALGAFPPVMGRKWLKAYNCHLPRFYYGAPWGVAYKGKGICYVAIRNMQWSQAGTFIAAGCGVVPESNPEAEWEEILVKLRSIKKGLGLEG